MTKQTSISTDKVPEILEQILNNMRMVIKGKDDALERVLIALLANGSILMEDVPGVGKTMLARALASSIDSSFHRVQFTPDLLPADILGTSVYNPVQGSFEFRKGPIFCHVLLADEINRASPRTQSALLEAMSEGQATIEGERYALSDPFLVIATENPVEFHGTYPLPEAQLDRFLIMLDMGYPDKEVELSILYSQQDHHPIKDLKSVVTVDQVRELQQAARQVSVDKSLARYMIDIVAATRDEPRLKLGVSPRGSLMLFRASQAMAFARGRDHVLPDDVKALAVPVLAHRVMLTSKAKYSGVSKATVIADILGTVGVPA